MSQRWPLALCLTALIALGASACGSRAPGGKADPAAWEQVPGDAQAGRKLFVEKGCGVCHVARGVPEAMGTIGPNLAGSPTKEQIAEVIPNTPDNMKRWLINPPAVKPGTAMPQLGVTDREADDLVAFLATLK